MPPIWGDREFRGHFQGIDIMTWRGFILLPRVSRAVPTTKFRAELLQLCRGSPVLLRHFRFSPNQTENLRQSFQWVLQPIWRRRNLCGIFTLIQQFAASGWPRCHIKLRVILASARKKFPDFLWKSQTDNLTIYPTRKYLQYLFVFFFQENNVSVGNRSLLKDLTWLFILFLDCSPQKNLSGDNCNAFQQYVCTFLSSQFWLCFSFSIIHIILTC